MPDRDKFGDQLMLTLWCFLAAVSPEKILSKNGKLCQNNMVSTSYGEGGVFMLKKVILILAGILLFSAVAAEAADKTIALIVNNKQVQVVPAPFIRDGRVFVPLGAVTKTLGAQAVWDEKNYAVRINQNQQSQQNQPSLGDSYLKGKSFSQDAGGGIQNNFITAEQLRNVLDDDKDGDFADYRAGHSGGDQIANDPLLVDVRNKADYDANHIPGAIWIASAENMAAPQNVQALKSLLKEHVAAGGRNEIVVYCYTGNTAGLLAGVLGAQGLPMKSLRFGFDLSWSGTGTVPPPISAPMENSNGQTAASCGG